MVEESESNSFEQRIFNGSGVCKYSEWYRRQGGIALNAGSVENSLIASG
jgi:hypothetical protein